MYSIEELEQKEKNLKKEARELGGLAELFPDISKNYDEQIATIKSLIKANKTFEENQSSRFGKGAKLKKEASAEMENLSQKLAELDKEKEELDKKIAPSPTILQERMMQLNDLVNECKTEEISALPFEELASAFSISIALINKEQNAEQKNEILIERLSKQQKEIQVKFFEKLRACEEYFVLFSPATHAPYMDLREQQKQACIWLFTKEEYAVNCRNYFARQYIFTEVIRFANKDLMEFGKNLPRLGYNAATINNGVHNLTIELPPLFGNVQYSCPINPALHQRRLDFFQSLLLFNKVPQTNHTLYEQFHNPSIMKAKESVMLHEFSKAQYTVVMKVVKTTDANGKEVENSEIPTNVKDDQRFLLIFTDMLEFDAWKKVSGFKTDEPGFVAKAINFDDVDRLAADTGSELLLDRGGWCFELTKQRRDMVKEIVKHVQNVEKNK